MSKPSGTTKAETSVLFGEWLIQKGLTDQEKLDQALAHQQQSGCRLGEALQELKILDAEVITKSLAQYLSMEYYPLDDFTQIDMTVARSLPENISRRLNLVAIGRFGDKVVIAMVDPLNVVAVDTVTVKLKKMVHVVVSSAKNIQNAMDVIYHGSDAQEQRLRDLVQGHNAADEFGGEHISLVIDDESDSLDIQGETDANQAPVVSFVDLVMNQAINSRASDVHIEPQEKSMLIRMRVDGALQEMIPPPRNMQAAILTRVKILAKMDIAERRLPQDGRFKIKASRRDIDVRVNSLPTIYGEKIVMRILDKTAVNHEITSLGLSVKMLDHFKRILEQPHGIVIVTGPTGSGKSTTLYSALNYLRDPKKNIVTVENPVEYRLKGINQVQVKAEIDFDFASCLRAILRQDPDIILVGEIRDKETVDIAIKASLTGHMVLSTFHTNDAPSAVTRFLHMGIEPYLLASTLNLIMAQRLVKRICKSCKAETQYDAQALERLRIDQALIDKTTFYRGKGCNICNGTGYAGRLPIFEFMPINNDVRSAIASGQPESHLRAMARQLGYGGLLESGVTKLLQGETTPNEVAAITYEEDIVTK